MKENPRFFDIDPQETREWIESLKGVLELDGPDRVRFLLETLLEQAENRGAGLPPDLTTPYVNTIPVEEEEKRPGDGVIERRIKSLVRWNAAAMVVRANREFPGLGGHIGTFASAANLYEVGFNYFFHANDETSGGDLMFYQGHSSPGFYARAFLEGRLDEEDLENFRREVESPGLSSYPHPWLMPQFWTMPTVSMGLGPIMAIYQARFMKYLQKRGIIETDGRKVWAFLGDGEMDEPEAVGALSVAGREKLDDLIFVVNCNLQRLDGPVRGNGKIIQELEGLFRGAGWNVIKVIWGSNWDPLLAKDEKGVLRRRMMEAVDGDYQAYAAHDGAYVRENFFDTPELEAMVEHLTDDQVWKLRRGGHDPQKVYAAFARAVKTQGQPTVVLCKTVKGYGMGEAGEGQNIIHQQKKMGEEELVAFRNRFDIPISEEDARKAVFYRPDEDTETIKYLKRRRELLGGPLPARTVKVEPLEVPDLGLFEKLLESSGDREMSTTMAFVRILMALTRHDVLGERLVPIVADEARTFGMEGLFRQLGIYAPEGQKYRPVDMGQLAYYREEEDGQILQEGITEAGAFSSWAAAGTAYANHGRYMVPFFIFYSMFGFQRIGDLIWASADMRSRGFLIGGTSGRTTLNGEGLQHEDGHSHVLASTVPTCRAYDPTFSYELAVIVQDGLKRMYQDEEDVFYYITTMNENYIHPAMPEGDGVEEGIRKGMYRLRKSKSRKRKKRVQLLGSGTILLEVLAASELLEEKHDVAADVWSVTSFNELRREGLDTERWNRLHPEEDPRSSWVERQLADTDGPVIAASDYVKTFADQIRAFVPRRYTVLGTDGFGRSDTRESLRHFFEVDRHWIAVAALESLAREGEIATKEVAEALETYDLDPDKPNPVTV